MAFPLRQSGPLGRLHWGGPLTTSPHSQRTGLLGIVQDVSLQTQKMRAVKGTPSVDSTGYSQLWVCDCAGEREVGADGCPRGCLRRKGHS